MVGWVPLMEELYDIYRGKDRLRVPFGECVVFIGTAAVQAPGTYVPGASHSSCWVLVLSINSVQQYTSGLYE